jgi:hypothetical protein
MANALNMERFRRQFNACLGKVATKPMPITALEKMELEEKSEADQAREFWNSLEDSFRDRE